MKGFFYEGLRDSLCMTELIPQNENYVEVNLIKTGCKTFTNIFHFMHMVTPY